MKTDVDTLVVMSTNRDTELIRDQVDAIRWSHDGSVQIVVVGAGPAGFFADHDDYVEIGSPIVSAVHLIGFKVNTGIRWAIEQNIKFKAVFVLDDDALPIGKGLDTWALDLMDRDVIGLLGVKDRVSYHQRWQQARSMFEPWTPKHMQIRASTDLNPETIFYAAHWMSAALAMAMHEQNLLVPPSYTRWDIWPDVYISWTAHLLGFYQVTWGSMDVPKRPLCLDHRLMMAFQYDPRNLHPDFKVFHTVRAVKGVTERELRAHYAAVRAGS